MPAIPPNQLKTIKAQVPFRLATTSFIYPDTWSTNARLLAPYLDELELLFFESDTSSLPSLEELRKLARIGRDQNLAYNIHLPVDVDVAAEDRYQRLQACSRICRLFERVSVLAPTGYILHVPFNADQTEEEHAKWQVFAFESLKRLISAGLGNHQLALETLDYPPQWLLPFLEALPLKACIDIGHLVRHGYSIKDTLAILASQTRFIHLHGVAQGRDHRALDLMPTDVLQTVYDALRQYRGSLSLEVFNYADWKASMQALDKLFSAHP
jgi:sugar phosphate isomerase/epimerase